MDPPPGPAQPSPVAATRVPRTPTSAEIAELRVLHAEVTEASEAAEHSTFAPKGKKRLRTALSAEEASLSRLGFATHADFVAASRVATDSTLAVPAQPLPPLPPVAPAPPPSALPPPDPSAVADPDALGDWAITPVATPKVAVPAPSRSELDDARDELASTQRELHEVQADLAASEAARHASDEEQARSRLELDERAGMHQQAHAEAEVAKRQLAGAQAELQRVRAESARALQQNQVQSTAEVEELAAQLAAFQAETARVAGEQVQVDREDLERVAAELVQARELAATAEAGIADAQRSRDSAIDELAAHRQEIDKLRSELGRARADATQMQDEHAAARLRAAESEAALGSVREDFDRVTAELIVARRDLESALAETQGVRADLSALQLVVEELEQRPEPEPAVDASTVELRRLIESAERLAGTAIPPSAPGAGPAGRSDAELVRAHRDAGRELTQLEAEVAELRAKRRKAKNRLDETRARYRDERAMLDRTLAWTAEDVARSKREVRDAEAHRDQVRHEAETLAGGIAAEAASLLEDAMTQQHAVRAALQAGIEHATSELAELEAAVETVALDATALRTKLADIRNHLSEGL